MKFQYFIDACALLSSFRFIYVSLFSLMKVIYQGCGMSNARSLQITHKNHRAGNLEGSLSLRLIKNSNLPGTIFESSQMPHLKIKDSNLVKSNFRKCNMRRSELTHSNLEKSNLEWADLSFNTCFRINFAKANIQCAKLEGVTIDECRMIGADFNWTNLKDAKFKNSDLQAANFCNSDLEGAQFFNCKLKGATYNMNTKLPFSHDVAQSMGMQFLPLKIFATLH
jgi:uncharacterized protein YjbI with pentapeptide repeats